jgi:molybdenum cofactor cytidylyltransferase
VGVVLAGGASRRFGSDKLAARYDGRPLVVHAIEAAAAVAAVSGVIVAAPASGSPPWLADVPPEVEVVRDAVAFAGPVAGLAVALGALRPRDVALVLAGDTPDPDPTLLTALVEAVLRAEAVDLAATGAEARGPLPLAVRAEPGLALAHGLLSRGERRLLVWVRAFGSRAVRVESPSSVAVDVDTPDDLAWLATRRRASPRSGTRPR